MTVQSSGWGQILFTGAAGPLNPHWRRRWLSNEPKMNIVRCL